jgi:pimeloyl-ACP methyl ester carboxylesterase
MAVAGLHRYVDVGGIRTHYVVAGKGPPVVLLHGLGASLAAWQENVGPLSESLTVYALDIPGHGDSDKPRIAYTLEQAVSFMAGFMDATGISSAALVGNSMGGLIALRTAMALPERVTHLALVDSAGLGKEVSPYLRLASIPILGALIEWPSRRGTRAMLKQVFHDRRLVTQQLVEALTAARTSDGAKRATLKTLREGVSLQGVRPRHRLPERLSNLPMPVLVVWGQDDHIFPVSHAYEAARNNPSVRIEVFPQCGHWPQMEKAEAFNALLLEFLGQGSVAHQSNR